MNERTLESVLWGAGILAVIAGIVWTVSTVDCVKEKTPALLNTISSIEHLRAVQRAYAPYETALSAYARQATVRVVPLAELMRKEFPDKKVDEIRKEQRDLLEGWTLREEELALPEGRYADAIRVVATAEALRPPWRLTKCEFRTSPRTPGTGQTILRFEAIEKRQ